MSERLLLAPELHQLRKGWNGAAVAPLNNILALEGGWDDEREFFKTGVEEVDALIKRLRDAQIRPCKARALDFGCGVGRLTAPLAFHFDRVDGVDISDAMIDHANRYKHLGCVFQVSEERLPFEDETFDFVYSNLCLQHMHETWQRIYIGEFVRVLRCGAYATFHLPDGPDQYNEWAWTGMCGRPRAEVEQWIADLDAELVEAYLPPENTPKWLGYFYTLRKS